MKELFLVAYGGVDDASSVLAYAIQRAIKADATLKIAHILEWSPYSFLTNEELQERHKRRREELARAESAILSPALALCKEAGIEAEGELRYGSVTDLLAEIAVKSSASMIFVGRSGSNGLSARVFGSVPIGLAQIAPVPTVIVP